MPEGLRRWARTVLAVLAAATGLWSLAGAAQSAQARTSVTIDTAEPAGPAFMGLGVEWDPYDRFVPSAEDWNLAYTRLDFMRPGFIRVVEPATDYFEGYNSADQPVYRWSSKHTVELLKILAYAQSRGITVVLGDWSDPMLHNDPRIPTDFLEDLHDVYGFTNIRYYDPVNEPNYSSSCSFSCWTQMMGQLSAQFHRQGLSRWLSLVGPDDGNSWDDTAAAAARDRRTGLDSDNPTGGDSWVTQSLLHLPRLLRAYDSHRYATIYGIEQGVYENQMRTRRAEIDDLRTPATPYFEGEVGLVARTTDPFAPDIRPAMDRALGAASDPSTRSPEISPFVDSQPYIASFDYGVWMGDMMIQALDAGVSGASAWDLDDAMHVGGDYGSEDLKRWGFWNSYGGQDGYPASDLELRPWYYTWSLLARSFPAGSQPLLTPATGIPGVRIAAAKIRHARGYELSFAVVNDSQRPHALRLVAPSVISTVRLERYDYFAAERPADAAGFPIPAQVIQHASLRTGVNVELPSRGLVILSSVGSRTGARVSGGRQTLIDRFVNWSKVSLHSRGLELDRTSPAEFDYDPSRVRATRRGTEYLIFRTGPITSFSLQAFYRKAIGLRVYGDDRGGVRIPIALASTTPAPVLGGHDWLQVDLLPAAPVPSGIDGLEIALSNRTTEVSLVRIEHES